MDSKGEESRISYPNIFFMIDSFEEVSTPPFRPLSGAAGSGPPPGLTPLQEGSGWPGPGTGLLSCQCGPLSS